MVERKGELFDAVGKVDVLCITTNGYINTHGKCVMGRGCAKQATIRWPGIDSILANRIRMFGNTVNNIGKENSTQIYSFPVKPIQNTFNGRNTVPHMANKFQLGDIVPGWACLADVEVIISSAKTLVSICDDKNYKTIVIPQPGCGAGGLLWKNVIPSIEHILDDRFCIVSYVQANYGRTVRILSPAIEGWEKYEVENVEALSIDNYNYHRHPKLTFVLVGQDYKLSNKIPKFKELTDCGMCFEDIVRKHMDVKIQGMLHTIPSPPGFTLEEVIPLTLLQEEIKHGIILNLDNRTFIEAITLLFNSRINILESNIIQDKHISLKFEITTDNTLNTHNKLELLKHQCLKLEYTDDSHIGSTYYDTNSAKLYICTYGDSPSTLKWCPILPDLDPPMTPSNIKVSTILCIVELEIKCTVENYDAISIAIPLTLL